MAPEVVHHIEGELYRAFANRMPSAVAIAEAAAAQCLGDRASDSPWFKSHFSVIADTAMLSAQEQYLEAQRQAARAAFNDVLVPMATARAADSRGGSTPESLPPGFGSATRPGRRITTSGLSQPPVLIAFSC